MGRKALLSRLDDAAQDLEDQWDAARGHDTVSILLIALKKNFGSFNSRGLNEGELGGALRLAFSVRAKGEPPGDGKIGPQFAIPPHLFRVISCYECANPAFFLS